MTPYSTYHTTVKPIYLDTTIGLPMVGTGVLPLSGNIGIPHRGPIGNIPDRVIGRTVLIIC